MQTSSGTARCGDVELFYEDLGEPDAPPVLLIMGVGAQLPMWPDGFCDQLVRQGYRVIRFDHRDTGLSTKMDGTRASGSVYPRVLRHVTGRRSEVPYTLIDMADDVKGLLDHLGIERAHVVGASMGGMIAQVLAGSHPDRLASLGLDHVQFEQAVVGGAAVAGHQAGFRRAREGRALGGAVGRRGAQHLDHQRAELPAAGRRATPPRRGVAGPQRLSAGHDAPVRRHSRHRQPDALHPPHHRADGGHPRHRRPDGAAAQRP